MAVRAGGAKTAEAIRQAAIDLFFRQGYQSTTLREIAATVGIQVGSLYNHIESKEDLLYAIMSGVMLDLLEALDRSLEPHAQPVERVRAAVECHVMFHAKRAREVFVGNSELRSLTPKRRRSVVELRDRYETTFREILRQGAEKGVFHVADERLLTYAILATGTQVSSWYRPRGRMTLEEIASVYSDFVLRGLTNEKSWVPYGQVMPSSI